MAKESKKYTISYKQNSHARIRAWLFIYYPRFGDSTIASRDSQLIILLLTDRLSNLINAILSLSNFY